MEYYDNEYYKFDRMSHNWIILNKSVKYNLGNWQTPDEGFPDNNDDNYQFQWDVSGYLSSSSYQFL